MARRQARLLLMMLNSPSHPLPLKFRIGIVILSAVLALSLLEVWAGGVRFMKVVAQITQQIAEREMAKAPPPAEPPRSDTPGVVEVGIIPTPEKKP